MSMALSRSKQGSSPAWQPLRVRSAAELAQRPKLRPAALPRGLPPHQLPCCACRPAGAGQLEAVPRWLCSAALQAALELSAAPGTLHCCKKAPQMKPSTQPTSRRQVLHVFCWLAADCRHEPGVLVMSMP